MAPRVSLAPATPARPETGGLRALSAWILGRPPPDDELERLRVDFVLAFALTFAAISLGILVVIHFVFPIPAESQALARQTTPIFLCGLGGSVWWLRRTGSVDLAAQITNASVFVVVGLSTAFHGGLESPVLCLWAMVPIAAGLLAGRRAAAFWSGMVMLFLLGLHQVGQLGWFVPTPVAPATYLPSLVTNMGIACAAAAAAVALYEGINADLRQRLDAERRKLRHEAGHDPLTALPNRRLFEHLQDQALRRADRTKQKVALFAIDLDGFKSINDALGHAGGDAILREVAARLRRFTRVTDTIARLGGDEFVILVELLDSAADAQILAERLQPELALRRETVPGETADVTASIGIGLYPDDGATPEALHAAADAAMYDAKAGGGDGYRFSRRGVSRPTAL